MHFQDRLDDVTGGIYAAPTTFMLDDRQYMLIPSGTTLTAFALVK